MDNTGADHWEVTGEKRAMGGWDIDEVCVSRFEKDVVRPIPKNYEKGQGKMAV